MSDTLFMSAMDMGRRRAASRALLLLLLLSLGASACGSDPPTKASPVDGSAVTTSISPPESPSIAIPSLAALPRASGWLVSLRGGNLYLGDLRDGSEEQLTSSGLGASYAGYTGHEANITLYFVELTERAPETDPSLGTAILWRRRLGDAHNEHVFYFRPTRSNTHGNPLAHAASIAPDGSSFAFADQRGVNRYDPASGVTTLLANDCQTEPRPEKGCVAYINPQWSPDGKWILAAKLLYEGSISVVVTADGTSGREFADVGGDVQSWALDSRYFCAFNTTFSPGGVHLVSPVDGSRHPLSAWLGQATGATARSWDAFGKLAVADDSDREDGADRVAVFQIHPPGDNAAVYTLIDPYRDVLGWLPDGSGVIVQGLQPCMVCGERPPLVAALTVPDGTLRALPFAAFTSFGDGVVGAIPFAAAADD